MNVARNVLGAIVTLKRLTLLLTVRSDCMETSRVRMGV